MNKLAYIKQELIEEFIELEDICGGVSILTDTPSDRNGIGIDIPGINPNKI